MPVVLGVDPGSAKAGYAAVEPDGTVLVAGIEPVESLAARLREVLARYPAVAVAMGAGTRARSVAATIESLGLPVTLVDEFETTRRARELYFAENPPAGWRRLVPRGLLTPPRPVDDYAAVLIARKYFAQRDDKEISNK